MMMPESPAASPEPWHVVWQPHRALERKGSEGWPRKFTARSDLLGNWWLICIASRLREVAKSPPIPFICGCPLPALSRHREASELFVLSEQTVISITNRVQPFWNLGKGTHDIYFDIYDGCEQKTGASGNSVILSSCQTFLTGYLLGWKYRVDIGKGIKAWLIYRYKYTAINMDTDIDTVLHIHIEMGGQTRKTYKVFS